MSSPDTDRARLARFLVVVAAGALIDLAVSMALARGTGAPLPLAAAGGFTAGLTLNYVLFERWVFRRNGQGSLTRLAATAGAAAAALTVRLVVVGGLALIVARGPVADLLRLALGMSVSFSVNFVLVRTIFRTSRPDTDAHARRPVAARV